MLIQGASGGLSTAAIQLGRAAGPRVLDETFPLRETRTALERMEAGKHTGKTIVEIK